MHCVSCEPPSSSSHIPNPLCCNQVNACNQLVQQRNSAVSSLHMMHRFLQVSFRLESAHPWTHGSTCTDNNALKICINVHETLYNLTHSEPRWVNHWLLFAICTVPVRDWMAREQIINAFDRSVSSILDVVEDLDHSVRRIMLEAAHSCKREEVPTLSRSLSLARALSLLCLARQCR